jgi:hypothetical protein
MPNALLFHLRPAHADRQHIHVRGHARRADRFRAVQIGVRRAHRFLGGRQVRFGEEYAVVCAGRPGQHLHVRPPTFFAGYLVRQFRRPHRLVHAAAIVDHLVQRELRLEVVQRVRPVQRPHGEVVSGELMLGEQRAEDKHRIVATVKRLGVVQSRQSSAARFADTRLGGLRAGRCGGDGLVVRQGQPHGLR